MVQYNTETNCEARESDATTISNSSTFMTESKASPSSCCIDTNKQSENDCYKKIDDDVKRLVRSSFVPTELVLDGIIIFKEVSTPKCE